MLESFFFSDLLGALFLFLRYLSYCRGGFVLSFEVVGIFFI